MKMIIDDELWYDNLGELFEKLIEIGIDPIQWVEEGSDLSVFEDKKPDELGCDWASRMRQAFWGDGYLQALSNNTRYGREEIVKLWMEERDSQTVVGLQGFDGGTLRRNDETTEDS